MAGLKSNLNPSKRRDNRVGQKHNKHLPIFSEAMSANRSMFTAALLLMGILCLFPMNAQGMIATGEVHIHQDSVTVGDGSGEVPVVLTGYVNVTAFGLSTMFQNANVTLDAACTHDLEAVISPKNIQFDPEINPLRPPFMINFTVTVMTEKVEDANEPAVVTVSGSVKPAPGAAPFPIQSDTAEIVLSRSHGISMSQVEVPTIPRGSDGKVSASLSATGNTDEHVMFIVEVTEDMEREGITAKNPSPVTVPLDGSSTVSVPISIPSGARLGAYNLMLEVISDHEEIDGQSIRLTFNVGMGDHAPSDDDGPDETDDGGDEGDADGDDVGDDSDGDEEAEDDPDVTESSDSDERFFQGFFGNPLVLLGILIFIVLILLAFWITYRTDSKV